MSLALIYTTLPSIEKAQEISKSLLEERLVACVNIFNQMTSLYIWQGAIDQSNEVAVIFKTTQEKKHQLIKLISEIHPYEIPAIIEMTTTDIFRPFEKWVQETLDE